MSTQSLHLLQSGQMFYYSMLNIEHLQRPTLRFLDLERNPGINIRRVYTTNPGPRYLPLGSIQSII